MDFFRSRYFAWNRLTLCICGLWPYQYWAARVAIVVAILLVLTTVFFVLVSKIYVMEKDLDSLSHSFQFTVPDIESILILSYCFVNNSKMKAVLEHVKADWDLLQPVDTIIILKYAEMGRIFTLIITGLSVVLPLLQFVALCVADEVARNSASNDTFQLTLPVEYFFDHEENYYYILTHIFVALMIGTFVPLALGSLYMSCIQHARGMFDIVGQRIEAVFDDVEKDATCSEKMSLSIMFHTRAIEFIDVLNAMFGPLYMTGLGILVVLLSTNIFRLFQAFLRSHDVIVCAMHVLGILAIMAIISLTGQELVDRSSKVFVKAYSSRWYSAPTSMQKSLVFIMARSLRESSIKLTRSIILSFEFLASILQMAVSYFMALYSLQEKPQ